MRPECVLLTADTAGDGRVVTTTFLGPLCRVEVRLADGTGVLAQVASAEAGGLTPGTAVRVGMRPTPVLAVA